MPATTAPPCAASSRPDHLLAHLRADLRSALLAFQGNRFPGRSASISKTRFRTGPPCTNVRVRRRSGVGIVLLVASMESGYAVARRAGVGRSQRIAGPDAPRLTLTRR